MPLEKWSNEKWIEVFDRWLARTARYEEALRKIASAYSTHGSCCNIAMKALEDE